MSAKRRDKHQKRAKKKRNTARKSAKSIVLNRVKKSKHLSNFELIDNPPGTEKMSQVILNFAEPMTDGLSDEDDDAFRNIIGLAISVWNASLLPDKEQEKTLEQIVEVVVDSDAVDLTMLHYFIDALMKRKKKYFFKNKRFIIDYQIITSKRGRHLYVVSTTDLMQFKKKLVPRKAKKPWWKRMMAGLK